MWPCPCPLGIICYPKANNSNGQTWYGLSVCKIGRLYSHLTGMTGALTRSSAIAEGPHDVSCQLKSCQLPRNSGETTCITSPEQIEVMKLEGYRELMCNKHVHTTMIRSSRFHCLIGVINKPTTDRVVDIICIPTTCCGEIFKVHNVEIDHMTLITRSSAEWDAMHCDS